MSHLGHGIERGCRSIWGLNPRSIYRTERRSELWSTMTKTYTPWGWTRDIVELAEGILAGDDALATAG